MRKLLLMAAALCLCGMTTACSNLGDKESSSSDSNCPVERKEHLTDDEWAVITSNCEYFACLLDAENILKTGQLLPPSDLQRLMPRNKEEFALFYMLRFYPEDDCNEPNLYVVAAQYAAEDSLDMMEHVLNWSLWADSWEYPWEIAVEIEKRNPARFRSTIERIWDKGWTAAYEEYRDAYLEWLSHPENQYDQFVFNQ